MDWRHRAICRDEDPELFFPVGNSGPALLQIAEAKAVCQRCPVTSECLTLGVGDRSGRRRLGRHERGRASVPQAAARPRPGQEPVARRPRSAARHPGGCCGGLQGRCVGRPVTCVRAAEPARARTVPRLRRPRCHHLDRPQQLGVDERPHDLQARARMSVPPRIRRAAPPRRRDTRCPAPSPSAPR